jgi:hypothetical protein
LVLTKLKGDKRMPVIEEYRNLVFPFTLRKPNPKDLEADTEEIANYLDKLTAEIQPMTGKWPGVWEMVSHSVTVYDDHALLTIFFRQKTT